LEDYLDDIDHVSNFEAFHNKRKTVKDAETADRKAANKVIEAARARKRRELDADRGSLR